MNPVTQNDNLPYTFKEDGGKYPVLSTKNGAVLCFANSKESAERIVLAINATTKQIAPEYMADTIFEEQKQEILTVGGIPTRIKTNVTKFFGYVRMLYYRMKNLETRLDMASIIVQDVIDLVGLPVDDTASRDKLMASIRDKVYEYTRFPTPIPWFIREE